ncbi:MAG: membrane protein insertion efficiency factor YidD [Betaproteobacteria bacterium]|nr:membrane protein insertion efficiency factor YidD [Betaproteobacteria bacterium]
MPAPKRLRRLVRSGPWSLHQVTAAVAHPALKLGAKLHISLAKRLIPKAVERNALRRIVRESFRMRSKAMSSEKLVHDSAQYLLRLDRDMTDEAGQASQSLSRRQRKRLQYTLGPLLGPSCRFLPSCSTYAKEAFQIHGTVQGAYLSFRRLCRCHPFHPGGIDEVPAASLSHGTKPASTPESAKSGKPPFAS